MASQISPVRIKKIETKRKSFMFPARRIKFVFPPLNLLSFFENIFLKFLKSSYHENIIYTIISTFISKRTNNQLITIKNKKGA